MTYNKPDTKACEYIYVEENIIPDDLCDSIVQDIETREWQPHYWRDPYGGEIEGTLDREPDMQIATPEIHKVLSPFLVESGRQYTKNYSFNKCEYTTQFMNKFGMIRFNRYQPGDIMRQHHDHIHSIFDGEEKGIPVLSFILNFNDDYEGADLFFWEDTVVPLGKGDIIMFPSNWLFPHGVTEATKGKRYSGVCWGW